MGSSWSERSVELGNSVSDQVHRDINLARHVVGRLTARTTWTAAPGPPTGRSPAAAQSTDALSWACSAAVGPCAVVSYPAREAASDAGADKRRCRAEVRSTAASAWPFVTLSPAPTSTWLTVQHRAPRHQHHQVQSHCDAHVHEPGTRPGQPPPLHGRSTATIAVERFPRPVMSLWTSLAQLPAALAQFTKRRASAPRWAGARSPRFHSRHSQRSGPRGDSAVIDEVCTRRSQAESPTTGSAARAGERLAQAAWVAGVGMISSHTTRPTWLRAAGGLSKTDIRGPFADDT